MTIHAVALLAAVLISSNGQSPTASDTSAPSLAQLLKSAGLDATAVEDPDEPGRFVSALAGPGQLLVVTARCANDAHLRANLEGQRYREVYADLHACADPASKFFVHDMDADGLHDNLDRRRTPDIVYELASRQILLDGDWRAHELEKAEYLDLARRLEARYARLLGLLAARLAATSRDQSGESAPGPGWRAP